MLTIGQFSKVCQVSVKALHHYDKIGLLHPDTVDRWTGYRYYDETQIPTMLMIQRLKRYGFSLSEIGAFLEEADKTRILRLLDAKKAELDAQLGETARIIREMEQHMQSFERTGDIMSYQNAYEVKLESGTPVPILSTRQKMSVEEFGKYYGKLFEQAAREKIRTNGMVMSIYHDESFDPEGSDVELAVGVDDPAQATRTMFAETVVTTLHKGPYSSLGDAYGAIMRWIAENGYEVADAPYEVYLKDGFDHLPPEEWETRLVFPVKKK